MIRRLRNLNWRLIALLGLCLVVEVSCIVGYRLVTR